MLPLGRHIKSNYLSPIARSISKARFKRRSSRGASRSHCDEVAAGNPSIYENAELGQAPNSTTQLYPSGRELENLRIGPNFTHAGSDSPHMIQTGMQSQTHYPQAGYAQHQPHYAAGAGTDNAVGAPLTFQKQSIHVTRPQLGVQSVIDPTRDA